MNATGRADCTGPEMSLAPVVERLSAGWIGS
jgi:hypothetical protein